MARLTADDVRHLAKELEVKFIRLQFTDIFGILKNVAIPFERLEYALAGELMFDGSLIEGFVGVEKSDMVLVPDPSTFVVFPWRPREGAVARLICEVHHPDGRPFAGDPRLVLKRALAEAERMGYRFFAGAEAEFYLFHLNGDGDPTLQTHDRAGYFDLSPVDLGEDARRDMVLTLEQMGFAIEASHHEAAPGQHEIDFKYAEALEVADKIATFRFVVRTIAYRHGLFATFMPKPLPGVPGSGMHISHSLFRDGRNIFFNPEAPDGLSREARHFIAGLLQHARGLTAITNPTVNSYKRLVPDFEAPAYIAWAFQNRSPLVRVPAVRGLLTRVELRSPDPCCNPYLALAVSLRAGLDGIKKQIEPPPPVRVNLNALGREERAALGIAALPGDLAEALEAMQQDPLIGETLGEHVCTRYIAAKRLEWERYRAQVHPWELEQYLSKF
ncbi:MAG: Glutamine synthetase [Clostridia bacterium 62_21]|nr:MAG: Glutamine synthetase [Clostridia bacterium 62_21]